MNDWRPTASLAVLQQRAALLASLRAFFAARDVLEVDVPVIAKAAVTDPNIESFVVTSPANAGECYYLMTSPEFYMKRLLAAGCGSVYSLGHAFRAGDIGTRHQPEFTMLEWYRPGWTLSALAQEVEALVRQFVSLPVRKTTYRQLFIDRLGTDPHRASLEELKKLSREHLSPAFDSDDVMVWLDLLFSHIIEPELAGMVFVEQFPAVQAALAKTTLDDYGNAVAERFELYVDGVEIANAYQEETSPDVLEQRFIGNLQVRKSKGQCTPAFDKDFLAAMREGFPVCAGVALGVDRLFMAMLAAEGGRAGKTIAEVMPFAL